MNKECGIRYLFVVLCAWILVSSRYENFDSAYVLTYIDKDLANLHILQLIRGECYLIVSVNLKWHDVIVLLEQLQLI